MFLDYRLCFQTETIQLNEAAIAVIVCKQPKLLPQSGHNIHSGGGEDNNTKTAPVTTQAEPANCN